MSDAEDREHFKLVVGELHKELSRRLGRLIRLRTELPLKESRTKGWRVELGSLGLGEPRLEIWYCEWAGEGRRRIWYGFYAAQADKLRKRVAVLPESLRPVRGLSEKDMRPATGSRSDFVLRQPLDPREYDRPMYEEYQDGGSDSAYYGQYDFALPDKQENVPGIVGRATGLFERVIKSRQPEAPSNEADKEDDFACVADRQAVRQHLARERSRPLVEQCNRRDNYRCQVCEMTFKEVYGDIGKGFAEAHHVLPLSRLADSVVSSAKDLVTVCANCHRMLHRLGGEEGDIARLRRLFYRE
ncbi:HNH endonuclease [Nitrospira sp. NS4]|uniref:HNH endonuclease n=1 Tax=Nitrospira sp. NS4 TaxID=3414498 RepID=UPI003C2B7173